MNLKVIFLSFIVSFATMTISAQETSERKDFYGMISLEYSNFKSYDSDGSKRGIYGLSVDALNNKHIGLSMDFATNLGIVDWEWQSLMFRVGPNYSYIISDNVTFYVPFQGVLINSNYQDFEDFGADNYVIGGIGA